MHKPSVTSATNSNAGSKNHDRATMGHQRREPGAGMMKHEIDELRKLARRHLSVEEKMHEPLEAVFKYWADASTPDVVLNLIAQLEDAHAHIRALESEARS